MRNKVFMAAIAVGSLISTTALAQTSAGGGMSGSSPNGSITGGATAGTAGQDRMSKRDQKRQSRRQSAGTANSASTYGSGSIYTDRHRATGGVNAGGTASGTGSQSTSTSIDAYGETTRDGSNGEVYGDSTAKSTNPTTATPTAPQ